MNFDGDGRKRRSFLPAPKKLTAPTCTVPFTDQAHHSPAPRLLSLSSEVSSPTFSFPGRPTSSSSCASIEQIRANSEQTLMADRMRADRMSTKRRQFESVLRVGAKVKIAGVKPGILRYLGPTHFAAGIFCGIELLECDGNHDGKVNGYRYFTCAPNHGIFAPEEKVILDTSSVSGKHVLENNVWQGNAGRTREEVRNTRSYHSEMGDASKLSQFVGGHDSRYIDDVNYFSQEREGHARQQLLFNTRPGQYQESTHRQIEHRQYLPDSFSKETDDFYSPYYSSLSDTSFSSSSETIDRNHSSSFNSDFDGDHRRLLHNTAQPVLNNRDGRHGDVSLKEAFSTGVHSDNKRYLNLTFDREQFNQSADSGDIEYDNNFNGNTFSQTGNFVDTKTAGQYLNNDPSMDCLPFDILACSERQVPKQGAFVLSQRDVKRDLDVNSEHGWQDTDGLNESVICPACIGGRSKENCNASCHICRGRGILKDTETITEEGKRDQSTAGVGQSQTLIATLDDADEDDDEDDSSSDSTGDTEDDRIEADQSGQDMKASINADLIEVLKAHIANQANSTERKTDQIGDTGSAAGCAVVERDNHEGNDSGLDASGKTRKPIIIKKKRSENIDHKLPNTTKITSKLADYIKAPVPVKKKEEKENDCKSKQSKNLTNHNRTNVLETDVSHSMLNSAISRAFLMDVVVESGPRHRVERPEPPKPVIKKTARKSKWDNIMSQIEANKDKPKPMSEIKSSLASYLHSPTQQESDNQTDQPPKQKREFKSKLKELPPPPPKIDYSKIKSKLNVPTAASANKTAPKKERTIKAKQNRRMSKDIVSTKSVSNDQSPEINESMGHTPTGPQGLTSKGEVSRKENRRNNGQGSKSADRDENEISPSNLQLDKATAQDNKSGKNQRKANNTSVSNQSTKDSSPNCEVTTSVSNKNSTVVPGNNNQQELEHLSEASIQEETKTKMQLSLASQALDAVTELINYCRHELKTLECPTLIQKLDVTQLQLKNFISQIENLFSHEVSSDVSRIENNNEVIQQEESSSETNENVQLRERNNEKSQNGVLTSQKEEQSNINEDNISSLTLFYERQIELLRQSHNRQMADMTNESKLEINTLKISHLEEVQELRNKHNNQIEDVHQQHRNKMEDMTKRFESIKLSLTEKVKSMRKECEELAVRARNSEEALQKDSDVKVQIALAPYLSLPSEINSLKSVQEMRLEEIQKLRLKIMDLEKQLEDLPIATEKIISLQQKIENLKAIITIKTEREKQLHEKCQVFMRKYDRESRANKRISMDFEQVMWRMTQSTDLGSCESLAKRQQSRSPARNMENTNDHYVNFCDDNSPVALRVRKRNSKRNIDDDDRQLRSKSASFLHDNNENRNSSPHSSSSKIKQKKCVLKNQNDEVFTERMFHSAGPEILSPQLSDPSHVVNEWDTTGSHNSSNTASLYARSLSGITDSGVYDSMTRSDQLNTSVASTDSGWGNSINPLVTSDCSMEDHSSGPAAGNYLIVNESSMKDPSRH